MKSINHYIELQIKEINEHKWYLSERKGYDIGEQEAITDWIRQGHAERFYQAYAKHEKEVEKEIQQKGIEKITVERLHELIED